MGQIKWTEKASSNLENIHEFISKDSSVYATQFVISLIDSTQILENFPYSGRKVPKFEQYNFRELIRQGYRIIYQIDDSTTDIDVLVIVHLSRDLKLDLITDL